MNKPWRFTAKQLRKQCYRKTGAHSSAFQFLANQQWKQVKNANKRQLWLIQHNWIDEALYQNNAHKNSTAWILW